jgi:hypothetical protein
VTSHLVSLCIVHIISAYFSINCVNVASALGITRVSILVRLRTLLVISVGRLVATVNPPTSISWQSRFLRLDIERERAKLCAFGILQ